MGHPGGACHCRRLTPSILPFVRAGEPSSIQPVAALEPVSLPLPLWLAKSQPNFRDQAHPQRTHLPPSGKLALVPMNASLVRSLVR